MSAGRLNKNSLGIAVLLCTGLLLAGVPVIPAQERIPAPSIPVKRGDTVVSYIARHGNQRERTGPTEWHFSALYY